MARQSPGHVPPPGPVVLFATSVPLLLGTLLSDWAYSKSYVIQWSNFASWLNAGALVIIGAALAWSVTAAVLGSSKHDGRGRLHVGITAVVFLVGFINSLVHAKDAWAAMPAGLILSVIAVVLALVAVWVGLNSRDREAVR